MSFPKFFKSHVKSNRGLSMIEVIIIVAVIGILMILVLSMLWSQISKGRDARRKSDLNKIKTAFEEYYNDNGCYPPEEILEDCGSDALKPYLSAVLCDPLDGEPYRYVPSAVNPCGGYRIFAQLENSDDPVVAELGCAEGCGAGLEETYNYGVSSGMAVSDGGGGSGDEGGDEEEPLVYACYNGICNSYSDPEGSGCTETSTIPDCGGCDPGESWCMK